MTNKEILEKAIQKAIDGGWDFGWDSIRTMDTSLKLIFEEDGPHTEPERIYKDYQSVIFNHDFAKALWGERLIKNFSHKGVPEHIRTYKYHLQQMVIADEPIKYLGENL